MDKKLEILQKFNKTVEDLDFSIDEMSEEELEAKMEELFGEQKNEPIAFSATYKEKRRALENALDPVIVKDDEGNYIEETYYWIEDFSDEYVFVEQSHWTANNYECKFGRFAYTFDESEMTATFTSDFEEMVKVWLTLEEKANLDAERANYESLKTEYSEYKENHSVENSEVEELKTYKATKEAEERKCAENTIFSEYEETIGETEEFKTLKKTASEFSLENLKKECLCIVGMYSMTNKPQETTPKTNPLKFSLEPKVEDNDPYGGIREKYLNR